jgi:hypothetical protein
MWSTGSLLAPGFKPELGTTLHLPTDLGMEPVHLAVAEFLEGPVRRDTLEEQVQRETEQRHLPPTASLEVIPGERL